MKNQQKIPGVLKVIISLMLVMILLFLTQGCSETGNLGQSAQSQIPASPSAAPKAITLIPSEEAAAIGITAANYPRIDGSTSTLPLISLTSSILYLGKRKENAK